jgi:purine-nucleoside/S-methyl-5'-thioadenosine phosphorylase / adenosine deaminase
MELWLKADWPAGTDVVAGVTLRCGGVSEGPYHSLNLGAHVGDESGHVAQNRRRFLKACGLPAEPLWLDQVHGRNVLVDPPIGVPQAAADGVVRRAAGGVAAVLTADCLPVLFAALDDQEVAAAHAGWRGLAAGILEATVAAMHAPTDRILAWLGPAISQRAFEVGDEVREQFCDQDSESAMCFEANPRGRWQADLNGLARRRLAAAGLHRVFGGSFCTFTENDRFFSYRRDGECGRMCSFVFRNPA